MRERTLTPTDQARIERTAAAVEARGVHALFAADHDAGLSTVLELMPHGSSVAHGSSTTLREIGLLDVLQRPDAGYRYLNAEWEAEDDPIRRELLRAQLSATADYYLGSVQAICETGEAIAADAAGSRLAPYAFGPAHVIWVAGTNKLVRTREDGLRRVWEVALPLEDEHVRQSGGFGSYVGKVMLFERERPGRITLVLVGEPLGF